MNQIKKQTHTPGPWVLRRNGNQRNDYTFVLGSDGEKFVIATLDRNEPVEETDANARLIAAAPNLLEACRAALAHIEELEEAWRRGAIDDRDGLGGTRSNRNVDVRVNLSAAIERATHE